MTSAWTIPPTGPLASIALAAHATLPCLQTDRLVLRAPQLADATLYQAIMGSADGVFMGGPFSAEDAWYDFNQATASWLLRGHGLFAVERKNTHDLMGFVGIFFEYGDPEPELGYLFKPDGQGQGYAFEAAQAVLTHAFDTLHLPTLVSYIDPANTRSIALATKLGGIIDTETSHPVVEGTLIYRYPSARGAAS